MVERCTHNLIDMTLFASMRTHTLVSIVQRNTAPGATRLGDTRVSTVYNIYSLDCLAQNIQLPVIDQNLKKRTHRKTVRVYPIFKKKPINLQGLNLNPRHHITIPALHQLSYGALLQSFIQHYVQPSSRMIKTHFERIIERVHAHALPLVTFQSSQIPLPSRQCVPFPPR